MRLAMLDAISQKAWAKLSLGECVDEVAQRVDNPAKSGYERFVGLEHIDTGDTVIRSWGRTDDVTSSMKVFKSGDVIVARRNVYLRRAARADFDGVCSGDGIVLRCNPEVCLPGLLPFLLNTDAFWRYVTSQADGTMSKRITAERLKSYEFFLPPLHEQRRIVAVLEAADAVQARLAVAAQSAGRLLRSTVDSLMCGRLSFGHSPNLEQPKLDGIPSRWPLQPLDNVCSKITDGVHKRPDYVPSGIPFLTVENLTRTRGIDFETDRFISEKDHNEFCKRTRPERGDVLISKDGATLGVPRLVDTDRPFSIFVSVALLKPKKHLLDGMYLRYFFESSLFQRVLAGKVSGSAIPHIHLVDLRNTIIPLPPLPEQEAISRVAREIELAYWGVMDRERNAKGLLRNVICNLLPERA